MAFILQPLTQRGSNIKKDVMLYRVSLPLEAPNYCLCRQANSAGFSFINTGKQVHLKHARRHFERNLVKDVHHRSIQKLVKKLETRGSRSNACRLLSLRPIEGQIVQKYTPHNRTQRRYAPRDSSRQRRHFGKSIPEFEERRPVSAQIMSRSCFASFPVCVYKFSSHYLNNMIFYRQQFGASSERLTLYVLPLFTQVIRYFYTRPYGPVSIIDSCEQ